MSIEQQAKKVEKGQQIMQKNKKTKKKASKKETVNSVFQANEPLRHALSKLTFLTKRVSVTIKVIWCMPWAIATCVKLTICVKRETTENTFKLCLCVIMVVICFRETA